MVLYITLQLELHANLVIARNTLRIIILFECTKEEY